MKTALGLPHSLRARITAASVALALLVLSAAALLTVLVQRSQLLANIDESLDREAAQVLAARHADPTFDLRRVGDDRFIQIVDAAGRVVAASSPLLDDEPVHLLTGGELHRATISDIALEDDRFRIVARPADVDGTAGSIVVGENTDDLRDALVALSVTLAVLVPAATLLLGGVAWHLVGRTLRPVAAIRRQVGEITLGRLGDRVPVPGSQDEIADLATTMNEMLDRLDHASSRQRRFVADASHELRSPLTRLRTSLEVDLNDPARDLNVTGRELLEDVAELQRLIDELLFLARVGEDHRESASVVELDAVIDRIADRVVVPERITIDTRRVDPATVLGNEAQLARLLDNLVANALRYGRRQVWIESGEVAGQPFAAVEDDGPGIAPEHRATVFERFTRLDDSRTAATGGTGLGLAIVAEIANAHDASVEIVDGRQGGARFVVRFPQRHQSDDSQG